MTPAVASILGNESVQFESAGAVAWSSTGGSVSSAGLYSPPNFTGRFQVTAQDSGGFLDNGFAQVLGVFDFLLTYAQTSEQDRRVLVAETPSKVRHTRTKSGTFVKITAGNRSATQAELDRILEFWSWHNPSKRFLWLDKERGRRFPVYPDGEVEYSGRGLLWQWQVKVFSADEIDVPGQAFVVYNPVEVRHEVSFQFTGVSPTRGQYRLEGDPDWTFFGDWSYDRTKIFPTLAAGIYEARVVTRTGQVSATDVFTVF